MLRLVAQLYPILCNPTDCSPPGPSVHGDSPGKNITVGCHALLQGILPTTDGIQVPVRATREAARKPKFRDLRFREQPPLKQEQKVMQIKFHPFLK